MRDDRSKSRTCPRLMMAVAICGAAVLTASAHANLIFNGDFSGGNSGFSSSYTHYTGPTGSSSTFGPGNYAVDTTPIKYNPNFGFGFGDHTTGSGLMMIFDASTSSNVVAWSEAVPVNTNTSYTFSYWTSAWGNDNHNGIDPSPPTLVADVNTGNNQTLVPIGSTLSVPAQDGTWTQFSGTFNSGSSTFIALSITDTNTQQTGNDFVLDDISLTQTPEPAGALALTACAFLFTRRCSRSRACL